MNYEKIINDLINWADGDRCNNCPCMDDTCYLAAEAIQKLLTINHFQSKAVGEAQNMNFRKVDMLTYAILSMNGAAGKLSDIVEKNICQGQDMDVHDLAERLGDVVRSVAVAAYDIGYSLEDILHLSMQKLEQEYKDAGDIRGSIYEVVKGI